MTKLVTSDHSYSDGSTVLKGFLAYNESGAAKRPGVVVVHEAWGLGDHAMDRARRIAALGYVALAADLYGDRHICSDLGEAMNFIGPLAAEPAALRSRVGAAISALSALPQVDSSRMGAIGFCFGGTTVLEAARGGAPLRGVVSFHGGLETKAPAQPNAVRSRVLVCTGAADPMIPAAQVASFQGEMEHAEADWQIITYGRAQHSFTNPSADVSGVPGLRYDKRADERSWDAMTRFLENAFA
jgi:dienelactone hydrolase